MAQVELRDVRKSYGSVDVIHGIDLDLAKGEFIIFVGPSGCGKSTLLRMIAGLEDITSGELRIGGARMNEVMPARRGCAMVFQSYALYPHMTVRENMSFGLEQARLPKAEADARIAEAARMLQIDHLLDRKPKQLSGGQRQRVAIGRAITRQPRVFLFDEPLSNLDAALRVDTRLEIAALHRRLHDTTMIYVTHDQVEAMTLADRIVVLNAGRVEQVGTPMDLYDSPASRFVAGFIGSPRMNMIEGPTAASMGAYCIGIRPEHLRLVDHGGWSGTVLMAEVLGSDTFLHVETAQEGRLVIRVDPKQSRDVGDVVNVEADRSRIHRFNQDGKPLP
jgi:multiple sugar transport system ATP-binding protein